MAKDFLEHTMNVSISSANEFISTTKQYLSIQLGTEINTMQDLIDVGVLCVQNLTGTDLNSLAATAVSCFQLLVANISQSLPAMAQ